MYIIKNLYEILLIHYNLPFMIRMKFFRILLLQNKSFAERSTIFILVHV